MNIILPRAERFSFADRPVPVPGDLRINWRVAIVLTMLGESRAKRASLAKLHVLNNAVKSVRAQSRLKVILSGAGALLDWQMIVEPAFARAIDYVVGEGFAGWTQVAQRTGLQLTKRGIASWESTSKAEDILAEERDYLRTAARQVTEEFVSRLLRPR